MTCYLIGFFGGRFSKEKVYNTLIRFSKGAILLLAFLMNTTQILQDYYIHYELSGYIEGYYPLYCNFAHTLLGVSLFILMKALLASVFKGRYPSLVKRICVCSDELSYDVYLVHHFIILGPYSLMALTYSTFINIVVIAALTVSGAVLVNRISKALKKCLRLADRTWDTAASIQ